jgi:hypothetical protein
LLCKIQAAFSDLAIDLICEICAPGAPPHIFALQRTLDRPRKLEYLLDLFAIAALLRMSRRLASRDQIRKL